MFYNDGSESFTSERVKSKLPDRMSVGIHKLVAPIQLTVSAIVIYNARQFEMTDG
jgi:hypothetical protein